MGLPEPEFAVDKDPFKVYYPFLFRGADLAAALSNDLETVTVARHPVLEELKGFLRRQGALGSLMSGSGPTVFGLFDNEPDAIKAEGALRTSYPYAVFKAQPI